jgi:putative tricarboxylic transport membrane protein
VAAILIGVILGPMLENFFIIALRMSKGDVTTIFSSRLGNVLWVCLVISFCIPYLQEWLKSRKAARDSLHKGEEAE